MRALLLQTSQTYETPDDGCGQVRTKPNDMHEMMDRLVIDHHVCTVLAVCREAAFVLDVTEYQGVHKLWMPAVRIALVQTNAVF